MFIESVKLDLVKRIKLSTSKFNLIVRCFIADTTATQTSKIVLCNRNTVNRYYKFFRSLIVAESLKEREAIDLHNGVEADESYFGPTRQRGKRGRGASNKIIVFGLRKRDNKVYAEIIHGATRDEIMPIILATVKSGSDIYTDGWRSYDALAVYGYNHKKVIHEANQFAEGENHINGIESFWSWTKRRLAKFNGVSKTQFKEYLLESEWRFNHRHDLEKSTRKLIVAII